jgi:basic membrane protein A and related proteins
VAEVVRQFARGQLKAGIQTRTLASGGIGLTPYHDREEEIIAAGCDEKVKAAEEAIKVDPTITGAQ